MEQIQNSCRSAQRIGLITVRHCGDSCLIAVRNKFDTIKRCIDGFFFREPAAKEAFVVALLNFVVRIQIADVVDTGRAVTVFNVQTDTIKADANASPGAVKVFVDFRASVLPSAP